MKKIAVWPRAVDPTLTALACIVVLLLTAGSQPAYAAKTIGMLIPLNSGVTREYEEAFARHLKNYFRVPDEVSILAEKTEDNPEARVRGIRNLVDRQVDVLVCFGSSATTEAARMSGETPILFVGSYNPVSAGLVKDPERPGKNVTGVTGPISLIVLLKAVVEVTAAKDVAVIYNSGSEDSLVEMKEIVEMGGKMSMQVRPVDFLNIPQSESSRLMSTAEFVLMTTSCCRDVDFIPSMDRLMKPVACWTPTSLCEGAVFSYALDLDELMAVVASMTERLLNGKKPGDIPVRTVKKRTFVIDAKKAAKLKLHIPFSVFQNATSVSK